MRLIVPLQGLIVHGGGGLVLGSILPCALFYFLHFHLKRHRPPPNSDPPSSSSSSLPAQLSSRASPIARPNHSPYYIGMDMVRSDPYHHLHNPNGIIDLGIAENRVCTIYIYLRLYIIHYVYVVWCTFVVHLNV